MIRWYDYIAAIITADLMQGWFFASLSATGFWGALFFAVMIYFTLDVWDYVYCKWRLKKEIENGN